MMVWYTPTDLCEGNGTEENSAPPNKLCGYQNIVRYVVPVLSTVLGHGSGYSRETLRAGPDRAVQHRE